MTAESKHDQAAEPEAVLSDVWSNADEASADADCSPTKVCRNARDFTFDGIAEDGDDLATSWRTLLEREGKLVDGGSPIRDIVLGSSND
ncbi:MAG: hypothetical protein ACR2P0_12115 [Acidimicrobiales bacterium]